MLTERRTVYYTGRVQGVGFRVRSCAVANGYRVTGYVMNLRDGRVQLVAEGESAELDRLLSAVGDELGHYVSQVSTETTGATGAFTGFSIRHA